MKTKRLLTVLVLGSLALQPSAFAQRGATVRGADPLDCAKNLVKAARKVWKKVNDPVELKVETVKFSPSIFEAKIAVATNSEEVMEVDRDWLRPSESGAYIVTFSGTIKSRNGDIKIAAVVGDAAGSMFVNSFKTKYSELNFTGCHENESHIVVRDINTGKTITP